MEETSLAKILMKPWTFELRGRNFQRMGRTESKRGRKDETNSKFEGRHLCNGGGNGNESQAIFYYLEELELRNQHEVQAITEPHVLPQSCFTCQSTSHQGDQCSIAPSIRDSMQEEANIVDQGRHLISAPYRNTYNPDWRNHPNLSWKPRP